ncbi:hypothetical protein Agabi119p4_4063 [Agaricus bisporus var. burnettii]|uniref:Uncharacterized protein n=1 Tax=Agaricus bisporus var. burnettii TaxID=192524 RepID=A0A8H7F2I5_AGABI|nr:hypothetical protein Agabi119p4_4063 [Agaricus bisporus var. burnettii]
MPAPAIYVVATVLSAVGAAVAFKHFVYDPHLAPVFEHWAEEYLAHRRAQRQRQSPIPVPATFPLHERRGDHSRRSDSNSTSSHSGDDSKQKGPFSRANKGTDDVGLDQTRDVKQWRSQVERSQRTASLRHRANRGVRPMDQSIDTIPNTTMSPTHVIFDSSTSAPTTPTATLKSSVPSPPPEVSSIGTPQTFISESTAQPMVTGDNATVGMSPVTKSHPSPPRPDSPPRPSVSPIPSLSQSYPQEIDRERGVELLSPPSSGTSSPFTTFSPFVAPQALSPFAAIQPLDNDQDPSSESDRWSSAHPASQGLSRRSQHTSTSSHYQSFPTSPTPPRSNLASSLDAMHIPSAHEEQLSQLSSPSPINFASPNALSPRSPHSNLSDLESMTDLDVMSEFGSDGSIASWAEVSSVSGSANRR